MREIRQSGSEGGVAPPGAIPTPIGNGSGARSVGCPSPLQWSKGLRRGTRRGPGMEAKGPRAVPARSNVTWVEAWDETW